MDQNSIQNILDLTEIENLLKELQAQNQANREARAVLTAAIAQTKTNITNLIKTNPELANMIDIERLEDLDYVNQVFPKLLADYTEEKRLVEKKLKESLNILRNI